jgi:pSer/pThr/pTyr-binding forkhead associated (FHA) protein
MPDDTWTDTWTAEPTATHRITQPLGLQASPRADVLELVRGPGQPLTFNLDADEMVLGRGDGISCRVRSALVSRRHLRIVVKGPEVTVTDLNSQNGLYLNQVKVHSAILCDGDLLQIGDLVFVYRRGLG